MSLKENLLKLKVETYKPGLLGIKTTKEYLSLTAVEDILKLCLAALPKEKPEDIEGKFIPHINAGYNIALEEIKEKLK